MGIYLGAAAFITIYLLLLARAAWKTGELAQFLRSLAVVIGLIATVAAVLAVYRMMTAP